MTTIHDAATDGTNIVQRMRQVIARQTLEASFESVDLPTLVAGTAEWATPWVAEAREARGAVVTVRHLPCPGPAWVQGVPSEIREVLRNLVRNGIDAIETRGAVTVSVVPGGAYHDVQVSDTGAGMTLDVLAQIFRPFFTTKGWRGSGFGLATAYGIAQAHRGRLSVDSVPGDGTTCHFELPAAAPPPA